MAWRRCSPEGAALQLEARLRLLDLAEADQAALAAAVEPRGEAGALRACQAS
jgi:hypothetical protein